MTSLINKLKKLLEGDDFFSNIETENSEGIENDDKRRIESIYNDLIDRLNKLNWKKDLKFQLSEIKK